MNKNKMGEQICFYPYEDIEAVFKKAEKAKEKNELETLREFYHNMKFFYEFAVIEGSDCLMEADTIELLYEYAKKGAGINV